jgi:hypothetical protein
MKINVVFVAVLLMTASVIEAQNVKRLARSVYENSGLKQQISMIDKNVSAAIGSNPSFASVPEAAPFVKTLMTEMSSKNMEKLLLTYFEEEVPLEQLEQIADMFKNPLFKEFSVLEATILQPAVQAQMAVYKEQLTTNPPTERRLQLIDELLMGNKSVEFAKTSTMTMVKAMFRGGNALQPTDRQLTEEHLEATFAQMFSPQMDAMLLQTVKENSLFIYKDVSDERMAEYVKLWTSTNGKLAMTHILDAFVYTFEELGTRLGASFAKMK